MEVLNKVKKTAARFTMVEWLAIGAVFFLMYHTVFREGFDTCYTVKKVYLEDVADGISEGQVTLEKNRGRLYISFQGNVPYHLGGVYNHAQGEYYMRLTGADMEDKELGVLLRYPDRVYRLKTELLGEYDGYTHIHVVRKTKGYKEKVILTGAL